MSTTHLFYEGRVQGVGFRYTLKRIARGYEVRGWVRNLPDGRVELLAKGAQAELAAFLAEIRQSELAAFIKAERPAAIDPGTLEEVRGFEIRA